LPVNPLGISGEALAEDHLRGLGYEIVGRDVRTPLGQLDLVAIDGRTLVFVEVKTRAGHGFGLPQEAVDARKIRKLRQLGLYYLKMRPHHERYRLAVGDRGIGRHPVPHKLNFVCAAAYRPSFRKLSASTPR